MGRIEGAAIFALIYGGYHFYQGVQSALEKSKITWEGAYNAGGSTSQGTAIFEEANGPVYLFLNNSFENSGVSCDEVFDSMTAQFQPLSYRWPPLNLTETPYSPSDFNGIAQDGNAKGAFQKVCAKDPSTNFYQDLILLAKADYPTCKGDCDWTFCRTSTLHQDQPGGIVFMCDFEFHLETTWPVSAVAGGNIDQGKSATQSWQTAGTPLYAGVALLLVVVLLHCFLPAGAQPQQDESPGAELMA